MRNDDYIDRFSGERTFRSIEVAAFCLSMLAGGSAIPQHSVNFLICFSDLSSFLEDHVLLAVSLGRR